jgi:hypothetical protein
MIVRSGFFFSCPVSRESEAARGAYIELVDVLQPRSDHLPVADGASVPDEQPSLHFLWNLPANNAVVLHNRERSNNTTEANVDTGPHAGSLFA